MVFGSNPNGPTNRSIARCPSGKGPACKVGSRRFDSDSSFQFCFHRLVVRTPAFHVGNASSSLAGSATFLAPAVAGVNTECPCAGESGGDVVIGLASSAGPGVLAPPKARKPSLQASHPRRRLVTIGLVRLSRRNPYGKPGAGCRLQAAARVEPMQPMWPRVVWWSKPAGEGAKQFNWFWAFGNGFEKNGSADSNPRSCGVLYISAQKAGQQPDSARHRPYD